MERSIAQVMQWVQNGRHFGMLMKQAFFTEVSPLNHGSTMVRLPMVLLGTVYLNSLTQVQPLI